MYSEQVHFTESSDGMIIRDTINKNARKKIKLYFKISLDGELVLGKISRKKIYIYIRKGEKRRLVPFRFTPYRDRLAAL